MRFSKQMTEREFEIYLHQQIPITRKMCITVEEFQAGSVKISAKLEPNINHQATAFGGSINSLMTTCGWALAYKNIKAIDPEAHIVIQKSSIDYLYPITKDFTAETAGPSHSELEKFSQTYQRYGKARIKIKVFIYEQGKCAAEFEGQYVAFR